MSNIETYYAKPSHKPHVLAVDDDDDITLYIKTTLAKRFQVTTRSTADNLEDLLAEIKPDLLMLDYCLPGRDGLDVCHSLRENPEYDLMPILFISGMDDEDSRLKAYEAGADDFVIKPVDVGELRAKVEVWTRLARRSADLLEQTRYFRELAIHDSLTGLASRRHVVETLQHEMDHYRRHHTSFGLILLDIDGFKLINDEFGHAAGDAALVKIANYLKESLRANDIVSRYGGDEFLVILSEARLEDMERVCQKLTENFPECELRKGVVKTLTLSVGGAVISSNIESADKLIDRADLAMFAAKAEGAGKYNIYQDKIHYDEQSKDTGFLYRQRLNIRETVCRIINRLRSDGWADDDQICGLAEAVAQRVDLPMEDRQTLRNCILLALSDRFRFRYLMSKILNVFEDPERDHIAESLQSVTQALGYGGILEKEASILNCTCEWIDGSGIPNGSRDDQIPMVAKIIATVATYAWVRRIEKTDPLPQIDQNTGTQFDQQVVDALKDALTATTVFHQKPAAQRTKEMV